jgi:hypothetical protein
MIAMTTRVFLSHAWIDDSPARVAENPRRGLVRLLRDVLLAEELDVFYDADELQELDDIELRIRERLGGSTLLVCWYSDVYRLRRGCDWELMAGLTTDPERVVAVNPEPGVEHILPASLRGFIVPTAPEASDAAGWARLARRIADKARATAGVFGDRVGSDATAWHGDPPARFSHFVGRANPLWALDSLLRPASPGSGGAPVPTAVVVHGLGGVGKTALACEYAARFGGAYPGGIYWLRAGPGDAPADVEQLEHRFAAQLLALAAELVPENSAVRSLDEARRVVAEHIEQAPGLCLWVVDDLPPGVATADFRRWLAPGANARTVVTSRGATYRLVPNLALDVMSSGEAVELLHAGGGEADQDTSEQLAARLGYLPLALEVVGALAAVPGASAATLLAELEDPVELVEDAATNPFASDSATEHALSVTATFGPSLSRLDSEASALLETAAALNVGPLPAAIVRPVAERVTGLAAFAHALGLLLSRSLARRVDDDTFELHALVAGAALRTLEEREAFTEACRIEAARKIADLLGDVEDIGTHAPNRRVADFGQAILTAQLADPEVEITARRRLGRFLHVELRYEEASALEQRAVELAVQTYGADSRTTLTTRADHALSVKQFDAAAGLALLEPLVRDLEQNFGPDDLDVLSTKHNLAVQIRAGDPQGARRLHLEVYEARLRILGPDHEHTLFSLHSVLSANVLPAGYPDFVAAYEDLIARRTRLLGPDHTTTLTSISTFIDLLARIGMAERAVPLARSLVERYTALYGPDHVATLSARARLATALGGLADPPLKELRALSEEAVQSLLGLHGSRFDNHLTALSNACALLLRSGAPELSVEFLGRVLPLAEERLGPAHLKTLLVAHNHAAALASAGEFESANARYAELIPRMTESLGKAHRLTLRARRQQALLGDVKALRELAALWRELGGPNSPEYAEALGDLADMLERHGQPDAAFESRRLRDATRATPGDTGWI